MAPSRLGVAVALALLVGCGARTGLDEPFHASVDASADGAPDVLVELPCIYGRDGDFERLVPQREGATSPALSWANGRLAVSFSIWESSPPGIWSSSVRVCTTSAEAGWACDADEKIGEVIAGTSHLVWDGESFAACWAGRSSDSTTRGILVRRFGLDGALGAETFRVSDADVDRCRALAWADGRYLVATSTDVGETTIAASVIELSRDGEVTTGFFENPAGPSYLPTFAMAAADGLVVVAVERAEEGLELRLLEGYNPFSIALGAPAGASPVVLAARDDEAAVLWSSPGDAGSTLTLALVDLVGGEVGATAVVAELRRPAYGVELIAVEGGYLLAWISGDPARLEVAQAVSAEPHSLDVLDAITIADARVAGGLALATDGVEAYVAATVDHVAPWYEELRLQRLVCHR